MNRTVIVAACILSGFLLGSRAAAQVCCGAAPVVVPAVQFYVPPVAVPAPVAAPVRFYVPAAAPVSTIVPSTSFFVPAAVPAMVATPAPVATAPAPAPAPSADVPNRAAPAFYVPAFAAVVPQPAQTIERYYFHGDAKASERVAESIRNTQKASATGGTIVREYYYFSSAAPKSADPREPASSGPQKLDMPTPDKALGPDSSSAIPTQEVPVEKKPTETPPNSSTDPRPDKSSPGA